MTDHVSRFNDAVRNGDWPSFVALFHPDAVMTFSPGPSFRGRDEILAGYLAQPPADTMRALSSSLADGAEIIGFEWTHGGAGTMTIRRDEGLITLLAVEFDRSRPERAG
jgi:hypothetical protein